jgi:hypothetical protein
MSREFDPRDIQWHNLPEQYEDEMRAYIMIGARPSPFIQRVLDGDLFNAYELSGPLPETPSQDLITVTGWVNGQCPKEAFGSIGAVECWIRGKGLAGMDAKRRADERTAQDYKDRMLDAGGAQNVRAFMKVRALVTGSAA